MSNRKPSFIDRVREHIFKVWPGQVLVPPPSATQPSGLDLVARELHRQRTERARDHQYNGEELARAAACYISADHLVVEHTGQDPWPWIGKDDRGELTRVEQLVKGAALAIREIERISSGGAPTMPITDPLTVNVRVNGKTYEAPWPKANRTTTEVAEVESPPSNSADAFRPGLPPLELRRVKGAEHCMDQAVGGPFAFDNGARVLGGQFVASWMESAEGWRLIKESIAKFRESCTKAAKKAQGDGR